MNGGIYKDPDARKAYQKHYYAERRKNQLESPEYIMRKCIRSVKGLRKEIGDYNTNRVIETLENIYKESVLPTEDSQV